MFKLTAMVGACLMSAGVVALTAGDASAQMLGPNTVWDGNYCAYDNSSRQRLGCVVTDPRSGQAYFQDFQGQYHPLNAGQLRSIEMIMRGQYQQQRPSAPRAEDKDYWGLQEEMRQRDQSNKRDMFRRPCEYSYNGC